MAEGIGKVHWIIPIPQPELGFPDICHHLLPDLIIEVGFDIWSIDMENPFELETIPLANHTVALWNVVDNGLNVTVITGIGFFHGQVLTIAEHLVAKARFNMDDFHVSTANFLDEMCGIATPHLTRRDITAHHTSCGNY